MSQMLHLFILINYFLGSQQQEENNVKFNIVLFAKFIFIIGHIALQ